MLRAVETMDFIHEQQRALAAKPPLAGGGKGLAQIRHAGENRRQLFKMQPHMSCQQPRDGGLAATRRSPQDERGQTSAFQHAADGTILGQQMILAYDLVKPVRPQAFGQGPQGPLVHASGFEQIAHSPIRIV